jgi:hypothetical protein
VYRWFTPAPWSSIDASLQHICRVGFMLLSIPLDAATTHTAGHEPEEPVSPPRQPLSQWHSCKSMYKLMYRRYVFSVILTAIHFSVAVSSQSSTSIMDGFTIFGPLILTVNGYLWSLILSGTGRRTEGDSPLDSRAITSEIMGMCV